MNLVQEDDFLTVAEVATRLKVNPQTIRNWITRGEIRAVRVGARRVRILRADLDSFLAATGATAPRDPSASERAVSQESERLAAALKGARAALAADRKTDLAIALHTLILAAEMVLSTTTSPDPPAAAEGRLSDVPPADD
jgi:excisionase family DNA binding protein